MLTTGRASGRGSVSRQWWEPGRAHSPQSQLSPDIAAEHTPASVTTATMPPIAATGLSGSQPANQSSGSSAARRSTRIEA